MTSAEVDEWADILRMAILRQTVLYVRGYAEDRNKLMDQIDSAALDHELAEELRKLSEPEAAITERFEEIGGASS